MKNQILILIGLLTALAMILGLIWALAHDYHMTQRAAMQAGLIEKPNVNAQGYHWDKP